MTNIGDSTEDGAGGYKEVLTPTTKLKEVSILTSITIITTT